MSNNIIDFSKTAIDKEYLEFVVDLYIGFLRTFYNKVKTMEKYRWIKDMEKTKIIIAGEFQDNESIQDPQIIVTRGNVGWSNFSFDPYKSGVIDNTNTIFMDALQGMVTINHYSKKPYESSILGLLTFVSIRVFSSMFKKNGFQYVGTLTLGNTVPAGSRDYYVTRVLSPFRIKFEWVMKILVDFLGDFTIILKDEELNKVMNEILVKFGLIKPNAASAGSSTVGPTVIIS